MTRRRPRLFATWGKMPAAPCPRCDALLYSATGLSSDTPVRPYPGALTMCDQCGTWLAFTDTLALRLASAEEIEHVDPQLRALAAEIVARLATEDTKQ
jgi:hypothetical protein